MAVDQLLHQKGRQYKGQQGKYLAATKIQVCILHQEYIMGSLYTLDYTIW